MKQRQEYRHYNGLRDSGAKRSALHPMVMHLEEDLERTPIAAAVKTADGVIHFMPPPHRHHHTVHALHFAANPEGSTLIIARGEQGFVMSDGTFADREEAAKVALATGRITALSHPPKLYSEDLW